MRILLILLLLTINVQADQYAPDQRHKVGQAMMANKASSINRALTVSVLNNSTTGGKTGYPVQWINTSPASIRQASAGATVAVGPGVVNSGDGTSGYAQLGLYGILTCISTGAITGRDLLIVGVSGVGCQDSTSTLFTASTNRQYMGRALDTVSGSGQIVHYIPMLDGYTGNNAVWGVGNAGTGITSYTTGSLIYGGGGTGVMIELPDVATGNALISGGVGVAPSYGKINLSTAVSNRLPYANFVAATAQNILVGRGDSGAGDFQEITLGSGLDMSGTTLSVTSSGSCGSPGDVQYSDGAGGFVCDSNFNYDGNLNLKSGTVWLGINDPSGVDAPITIGDNIADIAYGLHFKGEITANEDVSYGIKFDNVIGGVDHQAIGLDFNEITSTTDVVLGINFSGSLSGSASVAAFNIGEVHSSDDSAYGIHFGDTIHGNGDTRGLEFTTITSDGGAEVNGIRFADTMFSGGSVRGIFFSEIHSTGDEVYGLRFDSDVHSETSTVQLLHTEHVYSGGNSVNILSLGEVSSSSGDVYVVDLRDDVHSDSGPVNILRTSSSVYSDNDEASIISIGSINADGTSSVIHNRNTIHSGSNDANGWKLDDDISSDNSSAYLIQSTGTIHSDHGSDTYGVYLNSILSDVGNGDDGGSAYGYFVNEVTNNTASGNAYGLYIGSVNGNAGKYGIYSNALVSIHYGEIGLEIVNGVGGGDNAAFALNNTGTDGQTWSFASTNSDNGSTGAAGFSIKNEDTNSYPFFITSAGKVLIQSFVDDGTGAVLQTNGDVSINGGSIVDSSGNPSGDFVNRILYQSGGLPAVDWVNLRLNGGVGGHYVEWGAFKLNGWNGSAEKLSVDWQNRILYGTDGSTAAINWSSPTLIQFPQLSASRPLRLDSGQNLAVGTYSGSTTTFGTTNGSLTNGDLASFDSSGNIVDSGVVASQAAKVVDTRSLTNQSADITTTNFSNTGTSGLYRVSYVIEATTADIAAGVVSLTIAWSDDVGANSITNTHTLVTAGTTQGTVFIRNATGSVSYATSHTGIYGSAKYALYMAAERLL